MSHEPYVRSDYLHTALSPGYVQKFLKSVVPFTKKYQFDAIAFRGMSGALLAPILALKTKKSLIMVRKPKGRDEASGDHSWYRVEGDVEAKRYLILDDFMCSGNTVFTIIRDVSRFAPDARCIGALFYKNHLKDGDALKLQEHFPCLPDDLAQFMVDAVPPPPKVVLSSQVIRDLAKSLQSSRINEDADDFPAF